MNEADAGFSASRIAAAALHKTVQGTSFWDLCGRVHQPSARVFQEIFKQVLVGAVFPARARSGQKTGYIRSHDLRHTFTSQWMMNGGDLFKAQQILGHQSPQMTLRYAHVAPAASAEEVKRLPRIDLIWGGSAVGVT